MAVRGHREPRGTLLAPGPESPHPQDSAKPPFRLPGRTGSGRMVDALGGGRVGHDAETHWTDLAVDPADGVRVRVHRIRHAVHAVAVHGQPRDSRVSDVDGKASLRSLCKSINDNSKYV